MAPKIFIDDYSPSALVDFEPVEDGKAVGFFFGTSRYRIDIGTTPEGELCLQIAKVDLTSKPILIRSCSSNTIQIL